jgi:predicted dehydrogenase
MRLGVVGTGYWGSNHARVAAELRTEGVVEEVLLCDADEDQVDELASRHGVPYVTDHTELAAAVDAAVVATPSPTHRPVATDLLRTGVDVLVEKPLALSSEDAWAIVDTAASHGRTLGTGHIFRYHPALADLKRRLDRGELGDIKHLTTSRFSFREPRTTAGALYSLAVHDVDVYTYLLGSRPDRVYCTLEKTVVDGIDETASLTLSYGETNGVIDVSWHVPAFGKRRDLVVAGSEATAYVDYLEDTVVEIHDSSMVREDGHVQAREGETRTHELPEREPLRIEVEDFLAACRSETRPRASGHVGAAAVELLEAAERSAETGRAVSLGLDAGFSVRDGVVERLAEDVRSPTDD